MAKYFSEKEFNKCSPSCSIKDMKPEFMDMLDAIRAQAGIPLVINSAYRSLEWEKSHGRTGSSSHCKGNAVDIKCGSMQNRDKIVNAARALGVRRIGIAPTYIHIDTDSEKTQDIIWIYDTNNKQY